MPRSPRRGPTSDRPPNGAAVRPARAAARARRALPVAAVMAGALALAACEGGNAANSPVGNGQGFVSGAAGTTVFNQGSGPLAPAVSGRTLAGTPLSLAQFRGHVVVLNFWGSWCTPCRAEAPALGALAKRFTSAGVQFLGVDIRDSAASARAFQRDFGIAYPSLSDPGDEIALAFRATVPPEGIPTTLVILPSGRIAARVVGGVSYAGLRRLIAMAVAERS